MECHKPFSLSLNVVASTIFLRLHIQYMRRLKNNLAPSLAYKQAIYSSYSYKHIINYVTPRKWSNMQSEFWHQRWQTNQIGFHLPEANPLLVKYFSALDLTPKTSQKTSTTQHKSPRVFLPLCGKTLDIAWLLAQGFRVTGAELSQIAINDLFKSLNLTPKITQKNQLMHYSANNLDLFVGDIFVLTADILGEVDAIYDRAALVALPEEMRKSYTKHLLALTNKAPQLLICFEYDQSIHAGPPFSINADEVKQHYQAHYALSLLASETMPDGLKGKFPATEQVWLLTPKA